MRQYNVEGQGIFTSLLDSVIYYVDAVRFSVDNECAQTAYDIASILRRRGFEGDTFDKDGGGVCKPGAPAFCLQPGWGTKDEGRGTREESRRGCAFQVLWKCRGHKRPGDGDI